MVTPAAQAERFGRAHWSLDGGRSSLEQNTVAEFIAQGYFARHLKKMRGAYAARRVTTVDGLVREFGGMMRFDLSPGGLHVIGRMDEGMDDVTLANRAIAAGYLPIALSSLCQAGPRQKGLLIGFTNVPEARAAQLIGQFRRALGI